MKPLFLFSVMVLCFNVSGFSKKADTIMPPNGYISTQEIIDKESSYKYAFNVKMRSDMAIAMDGGASYMVSCKTKGAKDIIETELLAVKFDSVLYLNCELILEKKVPGFAKAETNTEGRYILIYAPPPVDYSYVALALVGVVVTQNLDPCPILYDLYASAAVYINLDVFYSCLTRYVELRNKYLKIMREEGMTKEKLILFVNDLNSEEMKNPYKSRKNNLRIFNP